MRAERGRVATLVVLATLALIVVLGLGPLSADRILAAYVLVRVLALFLDGYSFVASGLITVCLWTAWALSPVSGGARRRFAGAAATPGISSTAHPVTRRWSQILRS